MELAKQLSGEDTPNCITPAPLLRNAREIARHDTGQKSRLFIIVQGFGAKVAKKLKNGLTKIHASFGRRSSRNFWNVMSLRVGRAAGQMSQNLGNLEFVGLVGPLNLCFYYFCLN